MVDNGKVNLETFCSNKCTPKNLPYSPLGSADTTVFFERLPTKPSQKVEMKYVPSVLGVVFSRFWGSLLMCSWMLYATRVTTHCKRNHQSCHIKGYWENFITGLELVQGADKRVQRDGICFKDTVGKQLWSIMGHLGEFYLELEQMEWKFSIGQ